MSSQITFEFDHEYAGDLAALGIEYKSNVDDDYTIDVTVDKWQCDDQLFGWLDTNCSAWY